MLVFGFGFEKFSCINDEQRKDENKRQNRKSNIILASPITTLNNSA